MHIIFAILAAIGPKEGKYVVTGKLYRSDELSKLTEADQKKLAALGIEKIIDYRNAQERVDNEDKPIGNAQVLYLTPIADIAALASSEEGSQWRFLQKKSPPKLQKN